MGFLDRYRTPKPTVGEVFHALKQREGLDPTTNLRVKCLRGRDRHLWQRIGDWDSPYWICAYCHVPCRREYQHEGVFDMNTAAICDKIYPPDGD